MASEGYRIDRNMGEADITGVMTGISEEEELTGDSVNVWEYI